MGDLSNNTISVVMHRRTLWYGPYSPEIVVILTPNLTFATVFNYNFKAPKGKHMTIDFDDFEIEASSNGNCVDYVEVRHNLIGQPGER